MASGAQSTMHAAIDNKADLLSTHSDAEHAGLSEEEYTHFTKSTIRKVDWRLLPLLGTLSALSLIDRSNLGLARTVGMDHDLHLSIGSRYSIVSCIYFVPYIVFQLPSNLFLRKLGGVHWLASLVISWGAVQLAMGFVPSWGFLALCRALLGAFEAGFFPALVYIITTWYTRHEVQKRLAAFYVVGIFIGGFSAILAYVLSLLHGRFGIVGWAWIFIVEGAVTIAFGIVGWFFIPSFPDQNSFLRPDQTAFVLQRVEKDRGDSVPDVLTKEKLVLHLLDWKLWAVGLMYMCATLPAYAISSFLTIILRGMGWSISASLLLSAPPYIFATVSIMFFSWISDKYRQRAAIIAVQTVMTMIGLFLTGFAPRPGWRYAGIFLSNSGSGGCIPGILAYSSNNIISHTKRAVSTAIIVSFGGIGGIFASLVFRQVDYPTYLPGIYATVACQFLMLVLLAVTTLHYWHKNKSIIQGTAAEPLEGREGFLYTL
ncbi:major facilitator superfamily domain-containing protein [Gymnopilus junonius]|uniref:Major facilitator superfamily domain-containing protein n=1 Tax=Gymnopilus junonius TaxID=109634 RepID=A0A9P5TSK5_GYMJU|nr:major facilitator superfamily domain-containing protein [Gymnopilus junonius]